MEDKLDHHNLTQEGKTISKNLSKQIDNKENDNFRFFNDIDEGNFLVES